MVEHMCVCTSNVLGHKLHCRVRAMVSCDRTELSVVELKNGW